MSLSIHQSKEHDWIGWRSIKQLNQSHIEDVLENLGQNTNRIANMKSYLLTTLYNARFTMNHYYYQQVQCDIERMD